MYRQMLSAFLMLVAPLSNALAETSIERIDDVVDRMFRAYDRSNAPGASVLIVKDGEVRYQQAYGIANLEASEAAILSTNYRLASVSKQFTAMAIMILKEQGLLTYEDKLTDLVEGFPRYGNNITVRHLLYHTSGLRDYERHIPPDRQEQLKDADVVDILKSLRSTYFTPGSQYRYSNSGYATLAHIVALKTGQRFSEFLRESIFIPLSMNATVAFEDGINSVDDRAYGYTFRGRSFTRTDQSMTSAVLGDGGVYTSVIDYFKWDQALYTDRLVSFDTLSEAFTKGRLNSGARIGYGFGWKLDTYRGLERVSHTGSTIGFRTAVQRFPGENFSVLVLINRAGSAPWDLAESIVDLYLFSENGNQH